MKILIGGASGLIGSVLVRCLRDQGHRVFRLIRSKEQLSDDTIYWDPYSGEIDLKKLKGFDVTINLAGENIARGRWTEEKKGKILESRVKTTRTLCEHIARLDNPPQVHINASAVGYYGDHGDKLLKEDSSSGAGFLSYVCREWEAATEAAQKKGVRVLRLRIGVVLSPKGGALGRMLTPFKLGLGGVIGSGKQYMSWISIDDLMGVFLHVMGDESIEGTVNAVTPNPVTNREFTKTLGKVLHRPTIFPMPAFVARLVLGREMADQLLLASTKVSPDRLMMSGYSFLYPELEGALKHVLQRS